MVVYKIANGKYVTEKDLETAFVIVNGITKEDNPNAYRSWQYVLASSNLIAPKELTLNFIKYLVINDRSEEARKLISLFSKNQIKDLDFITVLERELKKGNSD